MRNFCFHVFRSRNEGTKQEKTSYCHTCSLLNGFRCCDLFSESFDPYCFFCVLVHLRYEALSIFIIVLRLKFVFPMCSPISFPYVLFFM